jgi:hypothetical protein
MAPDILLIVDAQACPLRLVLCDNAANVSQHVASPMSQLPDRLPLVIGAIGHRDLREQDIPELEYAVAGVIDRLKHDYLDNDRETPIVVLSSLAEGADRLIARVALARGARLIAPLPMPAEEYRGDFEPGLRPDARNGFDELMSIALAAPVMGSVAREPGQRALQYREAGRFIARYCHVLIALWDGEEADPAVGGTAETVSFRRNSSGAMIHVVTPRMSSGSNQATMAVRPWGQGDEAWDVFAAQMALTRQLNREAARMITAGVARHAPVAATIRIAQQILGLLDRG